MDNRKIMAGIAVALMVISGVAVLASEPAAAEKTAENKHIELYSAVELDFGSTDTWSQTIQDTLGDNASIEFKGRTAILTIWDADIEATDPGVIYIISISGSTSDYDAFEIVIKNDVSLKITESTGMPPRGIVNSSNVGLSILKYDDSSKLKITMSSRSSAGEEKAIFSNPWLYINVDIEIKNDFTSGTVQIFRLIESLSDLTIEDSKIKIESRSRTQTAFGIIATNVYVRNSELTLNLDETNTLSYGIGLQNEGKIVVENSKIDITADVGLLSHSSSDERISASNSDLSFHVKTCAFLNDGGTTCVANISFSKLSCDSTTGNNVKLSDKQIKGYGFTSMCYTDDDGKHYFGNISDITGVQFKSLQAETVSSEPVSDISLWIVGILVLIALLVGTFGYYVKYKQAKSK